MKISAALLATVEALLPPGPPGCRPRDVAEGIDGYAPTTVQNAMRELVVQRRAAHAGKPGGRRYWRAQGAGLAALGW